MDFLSEVNDIAVLKRLMFATSYLPPETPHYWEIVTQFGGCHFGFNREDKLSPDSVRVAMENIKFMNPNAFTMETDMIKELVTMPYGPSKQPLGLQLVQAISECRLCGGKLILRSDRPSRITVYTDSLGTVTANHFHKYCTTKGCNLVQYYGYSKCGSTTQYDNEWHKLPYFISSQETGFEMIMLEQFDVQLLIGQITYKQKADIYNIYHKYDKPTKQCSTSTVPSSGQSRKAVHG
jgi:hypothetical protein